MDEFMAAWLGAGWFGPWGEWPGCILFAPRIRPLQALDRRFPWPQQGGNELDWVDPKWPKQPKPSVNFLLVQSQNVTSIDTATALTASHFRLYPFSITN